MCGECANLSVLFCVTFPAEISLGLSNLRPEAHKLLLRSRFVLKFNFEIGMILFQCK